MWNTYNNRLTIGDNTGHCPQHPCSPAVDNMGQLLRWQGSKVEKKLKKKIIYGLHFKGSMVSKGQKVPIIYGLLFRDAVFRVLAVEQPQAVVLNYAPGSHIENFLVTFWNRFIFCHQTQSSCRTP